MLADPPFLIHKKAANSTFDNDRFTASYENLRLSFHCDASKTWIRGHLFCRFLQHERWIRLLVKQVEKLKNVDDFKKEGNWSIVSLQKTVPDVQSILLQHTSVAGCITRFQRFERYVIPTWQTGSPFLGQGPGQDFSPSIAFT